MRSANFLVAATLLAGPPALLAAQSPDYPSRPIRMISGFAAGGGIDAAARPIIPKLSAGLGQQVILDNRPGAGGNLAAEITARAEPDGYTVLVIVPAFAINASLHSNLPFNPAADFAGVAQIADTVNIISLHPSVPANSVKELVALARAKPLNFGSSGVGTIGHLAGELFNVMAGTRITHVAYKGGGPVMTDLLGGHIQLVFASPGTVMAPIKAGKIKALAVTTATRSRMLPDLPTVAESGIPGYEAKNWYGVLVPAHTPRPIVQRLGKEITAALALPDVQAALLAQGIEPAPSGPDPFSAFVKAEIAKWAKVVKSSGAKPE